MKNFIAISLIFLTFVFTNGQAQNNFDTDYYPPLTNSQTSINGVGLPDCRLILFPSDNPIICHIPGRIPPSPIWPYPFIDFSFQNYPNIFDSSKILEIYIQPYEPKLEDLLVEKSSNLSEDQ